MKKAIAACFEKIAHPAGFKTAFLTSGEFIGFILAIAYVPFISGASMAGRWAVMAIAFAYFAQSPRFTLATTLGIVWIICITINATDHPESLYAIYTWAIITCGYCAKIELNSGLKGLAYGVVISALFMVPQQFGWKGIEQTIWPAGLFTNKNFLAEISLLALIGAIHTRQWFCIPLLAMAVVLPQSKGVYVAAWVALIMFTWGYSRYAAVFMAALLINTAVLFVAYGNLHTLNHRVNIWQDTIDAITLFGHGTGMFRVEFPQFAATTDTIGSRPANAHNDWLELVFEHGALSAVFAAFYAAILWQANKLERILLGTIAVLSLAAFPLHNPATAFVFALAAGSAGRRGREYVRLLAGWRDACGLWIQRRV